MNSTFEKWLVELSDDIHLKFSDVINEEAQSNMAIFGVNKDLIAEWKRESIQVFLTQCSNIYSNNCRENEMVFYSWLDEMAGQIRISAVSRAHGKLPFRCKIQKTDLSGLVDCIHSMDSGQYTQGVLKIWCKSI